MKACNGVVLSRLMIAAATLIVMVGCSSAPEKAPPPSFDTVFSQAEAQVGTGQPDAVIQAFEEAAKVDPTRKEPWVRIAQLQFDRGNYARAIVAAEEALQRDPDDNVADGVTTVAGFRIANQSLQRLQSRGALDTATARTEATALATTLRKTMGDAILAPEPAKQPRRRARANRRAATATTTATDAASAEAAKAPVRAPSAPPKSSSGLFDKIGGN